MNEPHYLSKAKHFWNPEWCQDDLFLKSSNPHCVFYATVGPLTRWLTLEQTAWTARIAALLLLAVGWTQLVSRLVPGSWSPVWTVWLFLASAAVGNLSGEWMVGGVEAKVFAYALVFWALAAVAEGRWNRAGLCAGMAVSFHPVVGSWSLICAGFAAIVLCRRGSGPSILPRRASVAKALLALSLLIVCALPGLISALQLIGDATPMDRLNAALLQVAYRMPHHLDPMTFSTTAAVAYAGLTFLWLACRRFNLRTPFERFFAWFVIGSVVLALVGLAVGFRSGPLREMPLFELRVSLMKFYPFRLADVMVPLAFSVLLTGIAWNWLQRTPASETETRVRRETLRWLFGGLFLFSLLWQPIDRNPSRMKPERLSDWLAACRWIDAHTPTDSLFLCPPKESWAFKWYAQRSEYVSFKDCPQDAAGIVEWNRRLQTVTRWSKEHYDKGVSAAALVKLHETTGVTHLIVHILRPIEAEPVFQNEHYRVYRLPTVPE